MLCLVCCLPNLSSNHLTKNFTIPIVPKVKRVVYSTCSIHEKENEEVVQKILDEHDGKFKLVKILPNFPSRGRPLFPNADYCIRTDPNTDHTIGMFYSLRNLLACLLSET